MLRPMIICGLALLASGLPATAQTARQPKVQPGPNEPNWDVLLRERHKLAMFDDLLNPVTTTPEATPGTFRKAGPGPVVMRPAIALGTEDVVRGGWYLADAPQDARPTELWSYKFKNTTDDLATGKNLPPPLRDGARVEFDPGPAPFGLWFGNDGFTDGGVWTEPARVKALNARLAKQPYKVMIYPLRDEAGTEKPNAYLLGVEYSTNDDFQDIVAIVENVALVSAPTRP